MLSGALLLAVSSAQAVSIGRPQLVSLDMQGLPSYGPCHSPQFSANAQFITFICASDDIVAGDTNERYDTFLLDRRTGAINRVSLDASGNEVRENSGFGFPSSDGTLVVFRGEGVFHPDVGPMASDAATPNVFLRNLAAGSTELLSRDAQGNGNPGQFRGSRLWSALPERSEFLFASTADYVGFGSPLPRDIAELFVRNWRTGAVERISARPDGARSNRPVGLTAWSNNAQHVVFSSRATDLTGDNSLGMEQLFLRDRVLRTTQRLTRPWAGGEFDSDSQPFYFGQMAMSDDGRLVLFSAFGNDEFTSDDNPDIGDAYLLDRAAQRTELISRTRSGAASNGMSYAGDISADGRIVVFHTYATNMLPGPPRPPGLYLLDRQTDELVWVTSGLGPSEDFFIPEVDIAQDGRILAFSWRANVPADPLLHGKMVVYTVDISGLDPPVVARAVPALSFFSLMASIGLLTITALGTIAVRQRRENH